MNDKAKQMQDEINASEAAIKSAKDKKYLAERAAENEYWNTVSPINKKIDEITEQYKELAIEIAEQANVSPYSRRGGQLSPDEVVATANGMALTWEAEEHYNCVYHTVSWEEIFEAEKKQNENN